jgi:hypothetical protein
MLPAGQYIKHFQYGCGVVTESDPSCKTIDFDTNGIRKFVTGLMVVEPAQGAPPKHRRAKLAKSKKVAPAVAFPAFISGAR